MDLDKIKALIAAMNDAGLTRIAVRERGGVELELEKNSQLGVASPQLATAYYDKQGEFLAEAKTSEKVPPTSSEKDENFIKSPMVGTYYAFPSPDSDPFVKEGDVVTPDTIVCIIEAMKVMNEVKSGKKGVIKKLCLNNADTVEFGTKIMIIE